MLSYFDINYDTLEEDNDFEKYINNIINVELFTKLFQRQDIHTTISDINNYYNMFLNMNKKIIKHAANKNLVDKYSTILNDIRSFLVITTKNNKLEYVNPECKTVAKSLLIKSIDNFNILILENLLNNVFSMKEYYIIFDDIYTNCLQEVLTDVVYLAMNKINDSIYLINIVKNNDNKPMIQASKVNNSELYNYITKQFYPTEFDYGYRIAHHPFKINELNTVKFEKWIYTE